MKQAKQPRTLRVALLGALGLVVIIGLVVAFWPKPLPEMSQPIEARIELAAGSVSVELGGKTEPGLTGMALRTGTTVTAEPSARAMLRLPDGSGAFLRGGSSILIEADKVQLQQGEYWVDASPAGRTPFEHHIGNVRVSAADCGLSIKKDAQVSVYVARGMAIVTTDSGRVEVRAGERAVAGSEAPTVEPVAFWEDWTGGMADFAPTSADAAGRGSIFGVDSHAPHGTPTTQLDIQRQSVQVAVRDGLSETKVDQTFFNPSERDVEGWYWFNLPADASVTGFAVETNGVLVEGEFVEKREASQKYGQAKASGHSPAILEYVDARSYRARIFPIEALKTRRVVLRYVQLRPLVDGKLNYVYPMSSGKPSKVGEFSLRVDLGEDGKHMQISTLADARVESEGRFVTMRRSGFTPRVDFQLEAKLDQSVLDDVEPLRVSRFAGPQDSADYVLVRYAPDIDWNAHQPESADVVVVVDTSAAGDEATRSLKRQTAEAILRSLSEKDRFALVALDVKATVLHPEKELAAATEQNVSQALERLAEHSSGGATDLSALFDVGLARLHQSKQPALVYVGDGVATSGELTPEQLLSRLQRAFATSSARLFTVGVGSEADHGLLAELAHAAGGQSLRLDEGSETTVRALQLSAAIKLPTLTDLSIDLGAGLDQVFTSGGSRVARGSEASILARTHHDIPKQVTVRGKLAGQPFEKKYETHQDGGIIASFVPRLWASEYVRSILGSAEDPDAERGRISALGVKYGLVTPYSSILALESESAYSRMGIQRGTSQLRGVRLTQLSRTEEDAIRSHLASQWMLPPQTMLGCSLDKAPSQSEAQKMESSGSLDQAAREMAEPVEPASEERSPGAQAQAVTEPPASPESVPIKEDALDDAPSSAAVAADLEGRLEEAKAEAERASVSSAPPARALAKPRPVRATSKRASSGGLRGLGGRPSCDCPPGDPLCDCSDSQAIARPKPRPKPTPPRTTSLVDVALSTCSDLSARPLWQRSLLWRKRLKTADSGDELLQRYVNARRACELPDWRAERTFLRLLTARISNTHEAQVVLRAFEWRKDVQLHIGKLILRRTVDDAIIKAVEHELFGGRVNWNGVEIALSEIPELTARIQKLREFVDLAPNDPHGSLLLIELLVQADRVTEAVDLGRKIRERGYLTPNTARRLGDLLARAGQTEAALRAYSEIVEFDPHGQLSRRLLGDVYLAHGWYDPAYRQFKTITDRAEDNPLDWLRLATAAAGAGRIDEALRVERQVANAQGNPGPDDPRRWARLLSATRLSKLWVDPPKVGAPKQSSLERKLKELQLFTGPSTLVVLTWEDLDRRVALDTAEQPLNEAEATDAGDVGLYARQFSNGDVPQEMVARLTSAPENRQLSVSRYDIAWDGTKFSISRKLGTLNSGELRATL